MRVIIAGTRTITDYAQVEQAIADSGWRDEIKEIVSGGADGADRIGEQWAGWNDKRLKVFTPQWESYGKAAGPMRNEEMAQYADALILVWDGKSKGSADMKRKAETHGLKIFERVVRNDSA